MQVKEIYSNIKKINNSFTNRENTQLKMALEIEKCFNIDALIGDNGSNILLIEAPTGTGKSIAYLMSGIACAKLNKKKFVIATATKTLQNQLIDNDIGIINKSIDLKFTYAIAKGRANYFCPHQMDMVKSQYGNDIFHPSQHDLEILQQVDNYFNNEKWNGDIDLLPFDITLKQKQMISTDKDRCINYSCRYNQKNNCQCPFYLNKEELKKVDVIITNHSLLLADINIDNGSVFPFKLTDAYLCIDEAHNLTDNAISSFTKSFKLLNTINNYSNMEKLFYNSKNKIYLIDDFNKNQQLIDYIKNSVILFNELNSIIIYNYGSFNDKQLILNEYINENIGNDFSDIFRQILNVNIALYTTLQELVVVLKELLKLSTDYIVESNLNKVSYYSVIVRDVIHTCEYILNIDDSRYNANAKWIEISITKNKEEYLISGAMTYVGNVLYTKLWSKIYAAVITSATLSVSGEFNHYQHLLGLSLFSNIRTHKIPISFNYTLQSQLLVADFKVSPQYDMRQEFNLELANYLQNTLNYIEGYGTLVIFFNKLQMLQVYELLSQVVKQNILLQSDFVSNQKLVMQHKKNIDEKKPSVIFGLNSFAEGVDLPGIYCIHVIITKLPFDTNKTPYNIVQEYWIKHEKKNYFIEVSLPEACIRLTQATGRLIRSEGDYGQVTICDNRLINKNYGNKLRRSLMPFNQNYQSDFILSSFKKLSN